MCQLRPFKGKQLQKHTCSKSRGDIVQRSVLTTIVFNFSPLLQGNQIQPPALVQVVGETVNSGKFFISSINILGEGF